MVLIFEDLHWSDSSTLSFIDYAIPRLKQIPICMILVYRPYMKYEWVQGEQYNYIRLEELNREQSEMLLDRILDIPEMDAKVKKDILIKSEGNPFYVEEMVRALIDYNILLEKDGKIKLVGDLSSIPIPETVEGVILARIDRLEVQVKRILQCASVIGYQFRYTILEYLTKVQEELKFYLTKLSGMELIYEKSALPELEYLFNHILTQEVAYHTLLKQRRREYHGRIALCLEEIYHERLEEHYELLAHHYSNSNYKEKALEYCWKAGEKSRLLYANETAIDLYSRQLALMPDPPQTEEEIRDNIHTLLARGEILQLIGKMEEAEKDFTKAGDFAEKLNDNLLLADSILNLGDLFRITGKYDAAMENFKKSLDIYENIKNSEKVNNARRGLGVVHWNKGEYQAAREIFVEVLSGDPPQGSMGGSLWDLAHNWNNLGIVEWNLGNYKKAAEAIDKSLAYREELGDRKGSIAGLNNLGIIYERLGNFDEARESYIKALQFAEEIGFMNAEVATRINLGQIYSIRGEYTLAQEHYSEALKLARSSRDTHAEAMVLGNIGQTWCEQNRLEEAENYLKEALELSSKIGDHDSLMNAERGLAELDLTRHNPAAARDRLEKMIQSASEQSHIDVIIPCRRLLAKAFRELNDPERSKEEAGKALKLARESNLRIEEMWALYELAQLSKSPESTKEMEQATAIAQELNIALLKK